MNKKIGMAAALIIAAFAAWFLSRPGDPISAAAAAEVVVYKNAQCGCCGNWVEHMRGNGFKVTTYNVERLDRVKAEQGVPPHLGSCHTALVDGYVVEGHVPADTIRRLLRERPPVKGLAVPGMPAGSPGMEGGIPQPYNVVTFDAQGRTAVYESR